MNDTQEKVNVNITVEMPSVEYERLVRQAEEANLPIDTYINMLSKGVLQATSIDIKRFVVRYLKGVRAFSNPEKYSFATTVLVETGSLFMMSYVDRIFRRLGQRKGFILDDLIVNDLRDITLHFYPIRGTENWIDELFIDIDSESFTIHAYKYIFVKSKKKLRDLYSSINERIEELESDPDVLYEIDEDVYETDWEFEFDVEINEDDEEDKMCTICLTIYASDINELPVLKTVERMIEKVVSGE